MKWNAIQGNLRNGNLLWSYFYCILRFALYGNYTSQLSIFIFEKRGKGRQTIKGGEKTTGDGQSEGKTGTTTATAKEWMNDWTEADWGRNCWEQRWKGRKLPGPWRSTPLCFLLPTVTLLSSSWTLGRDDLSVQLVCVYVCVGNSRELLLLLDRILYWLVGWTATAATAKEWMTDWTEADGGRSCWEQRWKGLECMLDKCPRLCHPTHAVYSL